MFPGHRGGGGRGRTGSGAVVRFELQAWTDTFLNHPVCVWSCCDATDLLLFFCFPVFRFTLSCYTRMTWLVLTFYFVRMVVSCHR
jgi:hypothetical protein